MLAKVEMGALLDQAVWTCLTKLSVSSSKVAVSSAMSCLKRLHAQTNTKARCDFAAMMIRAQAILRAGRSLALICSLKASSLPAMALSFYFYHCNEAPADDVKETMCVRFCDRDVKASNQPHLSDCEFGPGEMTR